MNKVVIVGGGFVGSYCAKELQEEFEVVIIDDKPYFEFTPHIIKALSFPKYLKKIQVKHSHYLKKGTVKVGTVDRVTSSYVELNGERLLFDYLIICTGSITSCPIEGENVIYPITGEEMLKAHHLLKKSKNVLIVGGGLIGTEIAAELAVCHTDKNVTVVNGTHDIISRNNKKARAYATEFLVKRNVSINNKDLVEKAEKNIYITRGGKHIPADIVFMCARIVPNTASIDIQKAKNQRGQLFVKHTLQLKHHDHIFAAGDITHMQEEKTAQSAEKHAKTIVTNIRQLEGKEDLTEYFPKTRPMVISLGPYCAIMTYKNFTVKGFIPQFLRKVIEWKTMVKYR